MAPYSKENNQARAPNAFGCCRCWEAKSKEKERQKRGCNHAMKTPKENNESERHHAAFGW
jgi:hypothetical protein